MEKLPIKYRFKTEPGLNEDVVRQISEAKQEPEWMLDFRLKSLEIYGKKRMPDWGPDLSALDLENMTYFVRAEDTKAKSWEELPDYIRKTYERLGIPEAERHYLAGASAMYESEVVYRNLKKKIESMGVIFTDSDTALKEHEDLFRQYFMTECVPPGDNKFTALHGAVWSGGTFIYVPEGVEVPMPLQIYLLMNFPAYGQFEHTLIVAEPGSYVNYVEGCSAPRYFKSSLHSAVVEIFVKENARVRYNTIQNWSKDIYNLNTKRALVDKNGIMEWIGGTLGSGVTMLYPASVLKGEGAKADHINITFAGKDQIKEGGAKVIHLAPNTTSKVVGKSLCRDGGVAVYRGLVRIDEEAAGSKANVKCDALMLDEKSGARTYPTMKVRNKQTEVGHEATVGKITDEELFYLKSRGLSEEEAMMMIINGFIEPITKEMPLEYAVELNRLIGLEMEGSVG
jgi:Fe-S cluster assembly protein SufB